MNDIEQISSKAFSQASQIATDSRFTGKHKSEQIQAIVSSTLDTIERTYQANRERIEADIRTYEAFYISPVPSAEQAAQLNYAKDSIKTSWQGKTGATIAAMWQAAIDNQDKIAARIYRDFAPNEIAKRLDKLPSGERVPEDFISPVTQALVEASDDLMLDASAKANRDKLATARIDLQALNAAYGQAKLSLSGARIVNGQLVSGQDNAISAKFGKL